ncbi:glycoside hydrolase family 108 protein [Aeromonas salmonicida]|uniref:Glycosyl hydrolase 108 family protein n=1 Tax=Aeromonas salmonicida TaxID=645 RepID=A0AAX3VVK7_AERSA|nr:glycosyl hydrolase 108 family protein [Aeromonas salmonicida]RSM31807.1 secretion activator protein [Aeromonas salmonicida]WHF37519.1 glycosyl hydrolase 108 family protein [Aeromonas salmonicida]
MLPDTFSTALAWLLRPDVEGGEVNHPADRGGHTKYGIADAADGKKDGMADLDRDGQPDIAIRDLTPAHTELFYRANYWLPARCDRVDSVCPLIAIALFDGAVHHSPGRSVRQLQQALGILADGVLGPQTLRVLTAKTGRDGGRALLLGLLEIRASYMLGIVRKDPSQWANAWGWVNRLLRLQSYLLSTRFGEVA